MDVSTARQSERGARFEARPPHLRLQRMYSARATVLSAVRLISLGVLVVLKVALPDHHVPLDHAVGLQVQLSQRNETKEHVLDAAGQEDNAVVTRAPIRR